jgi:hypothetical protein
MNIAAWFKRRQKPVQRRGTFVMDATMARSEELRVDRLGPSQDDVVPHDPERPSRTLGKLPKL